MNCGTCKHWSPEDTVDELGECRRYPPIYVGPPVGDDLDLDDYWARCLHPITSHAAGCGEFQAKDSV